MADERTPQDRMKELIEDAIAITGAERVPAGGIQLWRIPGFNGSFQIELVVTEAIRMIGKAGWE